jgi:hypothetical protein
VCSSDLKTVVPNLVMVRVPASGVVDFYNYSGAVHVVADVLGYFDGTKTTEAGRFVGLTPARLLDTRPAPAVGSGETRVLQVAGNGGVPATGAESVVLNVTVTAPTMPGYLTVFPNDRCSPPLASNLNFISTQTVPNAVIVRLSTMPGCAASAGSLGFFNFKGSTHVVVDVFGYFTDAGL